MAAPVLGAIMTIAGTVLCIVCVEYIYKKEMRKVELGEAPGWNSLGNEAALSGKKEKHAGLFGSFFPMIVIIGMQYGHRRYRRYDAGCYRNVHRHHRDHRIQLQVSGRS